MAPESVAPDQRFSAGHKCPACGGWDGGRGTERCNGFIGDKGQTFCRRERSDIETEILGIRFFVHPAPGDEPRKGKRDAKKSKPKERQANPRRDPDLIHEYADLKGTLVLQVLRWYIPGDGEEPPSKKISQRIPNPAKPDSWIYSGVSAALPDGLLYNWEPTRSALELNQPVYITEGETDADAITAVGACATTNPMGADNFRPAHAQWMGSIESTSLIYLCMDLDAAGQKRCSAVYDMLLGAGVQDGRVSIVKTAIGGDIRDHLNAGQSLDDLVPVFVAELEDEEEEGIPKLRRIAMRHSTIESMLGTDGFAPAGAREYIIKDFLPSGIVGLVVAEGGTGKGHLMVHMGMSLALAQPFGPFDVQRECGWIYVTYEDDYDEVHRRIINHRAEAIGKLALDEWERKALLRNVRVVDYSGEMDAVLSKDLVGILAETRAGISTDRCVITVDPLTKVLPNDLQLNSAEGAGLVMRYLWSLSSEARASVLAVHHVRKPAMAQDGDTRIVTMHDTMGSAQLVNLSRWVLNVTNVEAQEIGLVGASEAVRCEVTKSNYTAAIPPMAFVRKRGGALVWREIPADRLTDAEGAIIDYVQGKGLVLTVDLEKQARKSLSMGGLGLGKTAFEKARKSLNARGLIEQSRNDKHRVQWEVTPRGRDTLVFSSGHQSDEPVVDEEEEEIF